MLAIVTDMIATYPLGGVAWDYGQYLVGLRRRWFEVVYLQGPGADVYGPRTDIDEARAAREHFAAERVLGDLLARAGIG